TTFCRNTAILRPITHFITTIPWFCWRYLELWIDQAGIVVITTGIQQSFANINQTTGNVVALHTDALSGTIPLRWLATRSFIMLDFTTVLTWPRDFESDRDFGFYRGLFIG